MLYFPVIEESKDLDLTPLLTTSEYYGPVSSYMPIATARFAFTGDEGAVFELASFDTNPYVAGGESILEDSIVCAAFNFFPAGSSVVLRFICNSEGRCLLYKDSVPAGELKPELMHGEDERGVYWSIRAVIGRDLLKETYGKDAVLPGQQLRGNIFKQKASGAGKHLGAIAPFGGDGSLFDDRNLNCFEAILM